MNSPDLKSIGMQASHRTSIAILLGVIMVSGLCLAVYLYTVDRYSLLYYGDAVSHLVGARKLFDWSENPGWAQLGTVWLPLPHFLLMFPSMIDFLFFSGFAGLAISLPSLALTSVLIYKIILRILPLVFTRADNRLVTYSAFGCALLFGLNPNFLYLGITAMTEAPFMLFFVASAYYVLKWIETTHSKANVSKQTVFVLLASLFASAACLCRYEGWILPLFIAPAVIAVTLSRYRKIGSLFMTGTHRHPSSNDLDKKRTIEGLQESDNMKASRVALLVLVSILSFSGITFWLIYNKVTYGNVLEFASAQYYSAASQALNRTVRETLFLQPLNILNVYSGTALVTYGPVILVGAVVGLFLYFRLARSSKSHYRSESKRALPFVLAYLALPPAFTILSLLIGIGEMTFWFNSRFIVLLCPLLVVLLAIFLARQPTKIIHSRMLLTGLIASFFVFQSVMPAFSAVVTYLDAKGGFDYGQAPYTAAVGEKIKELYDGNGSIMIMTGSAQEHRIMISSGIQLHNYDSIIESSTWKKSFYEPWNHGDRFVILGKEPDSDGVSVAKYWKEHRALLEQHYQQVFENKYFEILTKS